jgi:hypothetical protein
LQTQYFGLPLIDPLCLHVYPVLHEPHVLELDGSETAWQPWKSGDPEPVQFEPQATSFLPVILTHLPLGQKLSLSQ